MPARIHRQHPLAARLARVVALALFVLGLAGCGGGLSGAYEDAASDSRIEFSDSSKVYITLMGTTMAGEYEVDGEKIIITANGQNMVLTLRNNTLEGGPLGMRFVKK
jgi:hypothetical protein